MNKRSATYLKFKEIIDNNDDIDDIEFLDDDFLDVSFDNNNNDFLEKKSRKQRWNHIRLKWFDHVTKLCHEKMFEKEYRMPFSAWTSLINTLNTTMNVHQSKCSVQHMISKEIKIASSLRILFGGSVNDVREIFGLSNSYQYKIFNDFLDVVLKTKRLHITLPLRSKLEDVRKGFDSLTNIKLLNGCVGALDGFFQETKAPTKDEVGNVISFYSGHYESYGINCQGMCDSKLRFLFFAVVSPGSTNDNIAFSQSIGLKEFIEKLPDGMYIVADVAYTVSDKLLTPFTGSQKNDVNRDSFNFYLSQLRIRIEMAFGLLRCKFRILKKPLEKSMAVNSKIIMTCAILHNFLIDHKLGEYDNNKETNTHDVTNNNQQSTSFEVDVDNFGETIYDQEIQRETSTPSNMTFYPNLVDDNFQEQVKGISVTREFIVEIIKENEYKRPQHNLERNRSKPEFYKSKEGNIHINFFHPR